MSVSVINHYRDRFQRVLRHIDENLENDLGVETLSDVAAFSKFHFHRQFKELLGIGVYKYVQLIRLKRASYQLAFRNLSILQIALESGYEGPEAFSRAFKKCFGQTPSDFKKQPEWVLYNKIYESINQVRIKYMKKNLPMDQIRIIDFKETRIAALEHRGDPALIGDSIRKFIEWRKQTGIIPKSNAIFNILYNDPSDVQPEEFRLDIAVATDKEIAPNSVGIRLKYIPSGRCAVLRHKGSDESFGEAISYLYRQWLPHSAQELRDFPLYCQRVSFFPDVSEHEAVTDIFLPLK